MSKDFIWIRKQPIPNPRVIKKQKGVRTQFVWLTLEYEVRFGDKITMVVEHKNKPIYINKKFLFYKWQEIVAKETIFDVHFKEGIEPYKTRSEVNEAIKRKIKGEENE